MCLLIIAGNNNAKCKFKNILQGGATMLSQSQFPSLCLDAV